MNAKVVGEEGEHGGDANINGAEKYVTFSWELTLNVKVVGEEGEHGGAANVDGAVKHVTYYLHLIDKTKCQEQ